jgi:hypothetical protein
VDNQPPGPPSRVRCTRGPALDEGDVLPEAYRGCLLVLDSWRHLPYADPGLPAALLSADRPEGALGGGVPGVARATAGHGGRVRRHRIVKFCNDSVH